MPAFDNANSAQGVVVSSLTTSAWTIAGSNRLLVAGMGWSAATPPNYSEMRWEGSGGTLLTQVGTTLAAGSFHKAAMARLIAPNAVSGTLYGLVSGSTDELAVGGVSFTDADQTTPLGTEATNTGTGTAATFTATVNVSSATDKLVVDMMYGGSTSGGVASCGVAVGAGQTMRWEQENIDNWEAATQSTEPGAATVTMSEDVTMSTSDSYAWGIIGVSINSSEAIPGANAPTFGVSDRNRLLRDHASGFPSGHKSWLNAKAWW